jgi:hypothetical protein
MSLTLTRRYNADRFGYLIPHRYGNLPMVGAVATYRPGEGRFGGAVAVEEETENKIATPTTFVGWAGLSGGAVLDNDGSFYPSQAKFARVTTTNWYFQSNSIPATNGQTWSVSYIARRGTGDGEPRAAIMLMNESNRHVDNINPTFSSRNIGGGWVRYEATFTINREDTGYIRLRFYVSATNSGYHDFALPQLEQKPFATSFVDGTRANGRLGYEQFPEGPFTVAVWGKTFDSRKVHRMPFGKWNRFYYSIDPSNKLLLSWVDSTNIQKIAGGSIMINPLDWHFYVLTWDGTTLIGYIDGDEHVRATPDMTQPGNAFGWGNYYGGGGGYLWNGLLDEGLILPYAATEEEIKGWYEAKGPLPPHPQAALQWDWQAVPRRHNVDRFGYLIPMRYGNVPMVGAVATYRPDEGRFGRGAVAVEEGTTNLVPSNRLKFEGWNAYGGAQVTRTQNVEFPEIGRNDATRIRTTGGTNTLKYYLPIERSIANQAYIGSVYIKNIGSKPVQFYTQLGSRVTVNPGEWTRAIASGVGRGTLQFQLRFETLDVDDDLDFIAWGPQAEHKPFATSFVDGTRPDGILAYPIALPENHTIVCYRKSHTDEDYKHVVKRSDGKVFVNGVEDSEYDVGWIAGRNLVKRGMALYGWQGEKTVNTTSGAFIYTTNPIRNAIYQIEVRTDDENLLGAEFGWQWLSKIQGNSVILSNEWQRVVSPYFDSSGAIGLRCIGGTGVLELRNIKAERGSKATDWTPAPEDLGYSDDCLMFSNRTGLIDELLILPYAASEEEIVSWYEAQGPLPPHPQALLQWDWQAVRPAQIVKL